MTPKKKSDSYTEQELHNIKEQWLKDKAKIDADMALGYPFDRDKEYEKHLNNANLRTLFHHAALLYRQATR